MQYRIVDVNAAVSIAVDVAPIVAVVVVVVVVVAVTVEWMRINDDDGGVCNLEFDEAQIFVQYCTCGRSQEYRTMDMVHDTVLVESINGDQYNSLTT